MSNDSSKIYVIETLKSDPLTPYTLHWFTKQALKSIQTLALVENMLIDFINDDEHGIDLNEIFAQPPSREQFSTEEDYLQALQLHNMVKQLFTLSSKIKSKVNADELAYVIEYLSTYKTVLYAVNSVDGRRIKLLATDNISYKLSADKGKIGGLQKLIEKEE